LAIFEIIIASRSLKVAARRGRIGQAKLAGFFRTNFYPDKSYRDQILRRFSFPVKQNGEYGQM
jgi:hypothetical protein